MTARQQRQQGETPTPELIDRYTRHDPNAFHELANESVWESWAVLVALFIVGGLVLGLVGYMDAVARGFVK